jgi:hypothetical protein
VIWFLLSALAVADEGLLAEFDVGGDLKAFMVASFPYDSLLLPENPNLMGIGDGRLKLTGSVGEAWAMEIHHAMTIGSPSAPTQLEEALDLDLGLEDSPMLGFGTGVGLSASQVVELSWEGFSDSEWMLRGRTDRLWVSFEEGPARVTLGRQPVSFGTGRFFTPLDLVNPFSPATIDSEYKPGVDALRIEAFKGVSSRVTAVAAYGGDWELEGMVFALAGNTTVGVTDVGAFLGEVHGDHVLGASVESSVGAVGVHSDVSLTLPDSGDAFVRAVAGADLQPTAKTFVSVEAYIQTFGAASASDYIEVSGEPRVARGEVWQLGRYYLATSLIQEITPLIGGSLVIIANLGDPSLLVMPGLSVSVSDSSEWVAGAFMGLGKRPTTTTVEDVVIQGFFGDPFGIESEYGMVPVTAYAQWKSYF